jgi:hypothetical protein
VIFATVPICEAHGKCILKYRETGWLQKDPDKDFKKVKDVPKFVELGAPAYERATLKVPFGKCDQEIIYMDAPSYYAKTTDKGLIFDGEKNRGYEQRVDHHFAVFDQATDSLIREGSFFISIAVSSAGVLTTHSHAHPPQ